MLSAEEKRDETVQTGNLRVLVVDDEHAVTRTLTIIFANEGYQVRTAESAEAALKLIETEQWISQLAIIDVHLPGMNGVELAIHLRARYPQLRLFRFSGRSAPSELVEEARQQRSRIR